jgi:hypothetical protein
MILIIVYSKVKKYRRVIINIGVKVINRKAYEE